MDFKGMYEELKGSRCNKYGELTIHDFTDEEYQDLYEYLLEWLAPVIGDNYEAWYMNTANRYLQYKKRHRRTYDFYDPQTSKMVECQSIREQLATIKHYIQIRAYSRYPLKVEEE